jgi:hypothetical protein
LPTGAFGELRRSLPILLRLPAERAQISFTAHKRANVLIRQNCAADKSDAESME